MILFNERNKLVQEYESWLKEYPGLEDCPLSVISFLMSEKLIDEQKVKKFLENENG